MFNPPFLLLSFLGLSGATTIKESSSSDYDQDLSRLNFVSQSQCDSSAQIVLWEWEIWELWEELAAVEVTLETNG